MRDVSSMSARVCLACGEPLPSWSRVDKTTCNPGCRTRLCRMRKAASNTSVTRSGAAEPRSGGQANEVPPAGQTGPFGASGEVVPAGPLPMFPKSGTSPHSTNTVYPDRLVRVLAEGLRSIEERRAREQTEFPNRAIMVPAARRVDRPEGGKGTKR